MLSNWLRHYKYCSYFAKRIPDELYYAGHRDVVTHLLAKKSARTLVASAKEDTETLYGFLCFEPSQDDRNPVIHYLYVKPTFRRMGVAKALLAAAGITPPKITFTHWTTNPVKETDGLGTDALKERWPEMIYNPYKL